MYNKYLLKYIKYILYGGVYKRLIKNENNKLYYFPQVDYTKLKYDEEGLYSITHHIDASKISKLILKNYKNKNNITILDGTGGLGGNTINFSKYFSNVTCIELNKNRYNMLIYNIKLYKLTNVKILNCDSVEFLFKYYNKYNIYFFDPPWGGPNYKTLKNISLNLGTYSLLDITSFLKINTTNKLLVFKLPYNYNFNEFINYKYKLYKIKNYYIIIIIL